MESTNGRTAGIRRPSAAKLFILALFLTGVQAPNVHAQDASTFFWSTSVIHRVSESEVPPAGEVTGVVERPAAQWPTGVDEPRTTEASSGAGDLRAALLGLNSGAGLPPGSSVSIDRYQGLEALRNAATEAEIGLILEFDGTSVDAESVVEAVRGGVEGLIVHGSAVDVSELRRHLDQALGTRVPFAAEAPGTNADVVLTEPPLPTTANAPEWEQVYAEAAQNVITRIRVDAWPPQMLHGLMLLPGGLYLEGRGDDTAAKIEAFRLRHPAVGAGAHEQLVSPVYSFHRSLRRGNLQDDVVVVMGAVGTTAVNVSRAFEDDVVVRDAVTGQTAFVSFGRVSFDADPSGIILIEEVR